MPVYYQQMRGKDAGREAAINMENELKELSKNRMEQAKQCIKSAKALVEKEVTEWFGNTTFDALVEKDEPYKKLFLNVVKGWK